MIKDILWLGNPQLYMTSTEYEKEDISENTDDLAELVQHEYDHLDGILSTI